MEAHINYLIKIHEKQHFTKSRQLFKMSRLFKGDLGLFFIGDKEEIYIGFCVLYF